MIFRKANIDDADAIAGLVKEAFADYHVEKMIYGCHGIVQYLKDQLSIDDDLSDAATFVAVLGSEICAVAQFKRMQKNKTLYLNYICAAKRLRRKKMGSRLLGFSLENESYDYDRVALDVFESNVNAKSWYDNLGFSLNEEKNWAVITPDKKDCDSGCLTDLPQSKTCYQKYGFSQLSVLTKSNTYTVGILGDKYYRLSNGDILEDSAAIQALKRFDSKRKFLLITSMLPSFLEDVRVNRFAKTLNMSIDRAALQKKLS